MEEGKKTIPYVRNILHILRVKIYFLSGHRKQSCQQTQGLRTQRGVLDVSCAERFYSTAAVRAWLLWRLTLSGTWASSHWLLPLCQQHTHPWSRALVASQGLGVNHVSRSSLFLFLYCSPNSCHSLRPGTSPCGLWLFVHQRLLLACNKDVFRNSFFHDKLGSVVIQAHWSSGATNSHK